MTRYGLGYEDLRTANPGLIYCSITGFRQTGPMRNVAGYDSSSKVNIRAKCCAINWESTLTSSPTWSAKASSRDWPAIELTP